MGFDPKAFKKLVALCRKLGIQHYKCADFEFTLGNDPIRYGRTTKTVVKGQVKRVENHEAIEEIDEHIASGGLSQEELLFWSSDPSEKIEL